MWGNIIGAVAGGILSGNAAKKKAAAIDRMNEANMAGFNQYKPYVDAALKGGEDAFNKVLDTGYYQGPTYAGPNTFQTGAANALGTGATNVINNGFNIANATGGFGNNAVDLYGRYSNLADTAANTDRVAAANQYALDNYQGISDAILRDDRRNLQENTLTGIDLAASGSGNMNSSRAGVAEAVANRAFDDRAADVKTDVINKLRDASLNQQAQQFADQNTALMGVGQSNSAMAAAYNQGLNTANQGFGMGMGAGGALQGFDQAKLNDLRANFEGNRDFALNQYKDYMSGMLGRAPTTTNSAALNAVDPTAKTIAGMTSGFGMGGNFGGSIGNLPIFDGLFGGPGLGSFI